LCDGAAAIFCVACNKLLHLLLLSSLLAFLDRVADFFQHVVKRCRDDILVADLKSRHGVECLILDLTRGPSLMESPKSVLTPKSFTAVTRTCPCVSETRLRASFLGVGGRIGWAGG
jgi:hypothetical protein